MTGQELKKFIKDAALTQAEAAEAIGLTERGLRYHIARKHDHKPVPKRTELAIRMVVARLHGRIAECA